MKITIARTAGFCMGVKRAVDLAIDNTSGRSRPLHTLGPIIHNSQTIEMLKERGAIPVGEKDVSSLKPSDILIRAHGVAPDVEKRFEHAGHAIIDGTCPKVKTVHRVIEKYRDQGYDIIITGDEGHAEVIGLLGYAGTRGHLIQNVKDLDRFPVHWKKVCLVSQTTFDKQTFEQIANAARGHFRNAHLTVKKTICAATARRQSEARELSQQVDAMIVVGGMHSANTLRLAQICRECGVSTQHVESETDIRWELLSKADTVGITAGASTPAWMIKRVVDFIRMTGQQQRRSPINTVRRILDVLINMNIFIAGGAVALYYTSCFIQDYPFSITGALLAFLYFLAMYLWNSLTHIENTQHLSIGRYRFYQKYRPLLLAFSLLTIGGMLAISRRESLPLFYLMLASALLGLIYHVPVIPRILRGLFQYSSLKDLPTSRDLLVALAWGVVITFIPPAHHQQWKPGAAMLFAFVWIFLLAYYRSLIFDMRDIEGDRIMGRETLVTIIGEKKAKKLIQALIYISVVSLLGYITVTLFSPVDFRYKGIRILSQIPAAVYAHLFMRAYPRIHSGNTTIFSLLANGVFYISGIGSLLVMM